VQESVHLKRLLESVLAIEDRQADIRTGREKSFELVGGVDFDRLETGLEQVRSDRNEFVSRERDGDCGPGHGDDRLPDEMRGGEACSLPAKLKARRSLPP
jgi:hypothetical protein